MRNFYCTECHAWHEFYLDDKKEFGKDGTVDATWNSRICKRTLETRMLLEEYLKEMWIREAK